MNDDTTPFFHGRFHDVQEMVSCHPVLDMSYLQLGRGHFVGELSGFPLPNGVFWRSRANLGVVGSCDIPKGFLLVGVATLCGDYWHDRPVAAETMAVGNSCSGLLHRTSEGHGAWVWLIRHERYLELAETLGLKLANLEKPQILYEVLPGRNFHVTSQHTHRLFVVRSFLCQRLSPIEPGRTRAHSRIQSLYRLRSLPGMPFARGGGMDHFSPPQGYAASK